MEILKNQSVISLVKRAVRAGKKNPSVQQLQTLATAIGDADAQSFLKKAGVRELRALKTCIAVVNGEAPVKVSEQLGTLFGLTGEKETTIASEKQDQIYSVKPVEPTTEEQKDIRARKDTEEWHPDTSDRKTEKSAVAEPQKKNSEFKKNMKGFQEILQRGKKNPVEKRGVKKTAADTEYYEGEISQVLPVDKYGAQIQLRSTKGSSKWLTITNEFLDAFDSKRAELLSASENSEKESGKKTAMNVSDEEAYSLFDSLRNAIANQLNHYLPDDFKDKASLKDAVEESISNAVNDWVNKTQASKKTADDAEGPAPPPPAKKDEEGDKTFPFDVKKKDKEKSKSKVDPKVVDEYVTRIKKGEDPKKVLTEFGEELVSPKKKDEKKPEKPEIEGESKVEIEENGTSAPMAPVTTSSAHGNSKLWRSYSSREQYAELAEGQQVIINDPTAGQVQVTIEGMGTNPEGQKSLVGKTDAGELLVLPEGTQVMQEVNPDTVPMI